MKFFISLGLLILSSCTHLSKNDSTPSDKHSDDTVEISGQENQNNNYNKENSGQNEFSPHAVKANRNKEISLYFGALEDSVFQAIGVIKWLERNGYKISNYYANSEEMILLTPFKMKKKTSSLEWSLHQCCKEDFPLESKDSYLEIIKKQKEILGYQDQEKEGLSCTDFAQDFNQTTVLCVEMGSKDKVEFESQTSGMDLIKLNFAEINYEEKLSLVDYIDRGYTLAKKIKK